MLTSYKVSGVELNDGVSYLVAFADQDLDAQNPTNGNWATRSGATPVLVGNEIREGAFSLNIQVIPTHNPADFETRLNTLKRLFPRGGQFVLSRKLPTESVYSSVNASVREFTVNRTEYRVAIGLDTAERYWLSEFEKSASVLLFETVTRTEEITVTNAGNAICEPQLVLTAKTVGTDGPIPLYFREVTVYSSGNGGRGAVLNSPILLTSGWDTTSLVSAGKMRADGLDISVTLPDGTALPTYVTGSQSSRSVWVLAARWPDYSYGSLVRGPDSTGASPIALPANGTVCYVSQYGDDEWPSSGSIVLGTQVVSYTSAALYEDYPGSAGRVVRLGGLSGNTADYNLFTPVKRPVALKINYGYAAGYQRAFSNSLDGWPPLSYEASSNSVWIQNRTHLVGKSGYWNWQWSTDPKAVRRGEWIRFTPTASEQVAFTGRYQAVEGVYSIHDRAVLPVPTINGRIVDAVSLSFTVTASGVIAYRVGKVVSDFGKVVNGVSAEVNETLYFSSFSANGSVNTGWISTNQRGRIGTHLFFSLDNVNPGGDVQNVTFTEIKYSIDNDGFSRPAVSALGAEGGAAYGLFPMSVTVQNLDDSTTLPFSVNTARMVDWSTHLVAEERRVYGSVLQDVSYRNPAWLRLRPGTNRIQFNAPQGSGQVQATLYWKEKY